MNKTIHTMQWSFCLLGSLAFVAPTVVWAVDDQARESGQAEISQDVHPMDRTSITQGTDHQTWEQGQAQLQHALQPGQPADAYRQKLEEMGYRVTSVNYDDDDYLEYEIVKGPHTYEVQIDVDDDNHQLATLHHRNWQWQKIDSQ